MLQSEQLDFISSIQLPPRLATRTLAASAPQLASRILVAPGLRSLPGQFDHNSDNGAVVGESVMGIGDSLSEQNAEDVLDCISLTQQAADNRFNKEKQRKQWFEYYVKGLGSLGWVVSHNVAQLYTPRSTEFTMDQVALEIIGAVSGSSGFKPLAEKTLSGLKNEAKALQLLENKSAGESFGTFQLMPCLESRTGQVATILNCLEFTKQVRTKRVLFFKFRKSNVTIYRSATQIQLNSKHYARIRHAVQDKLSGGATDFLESIKL